MQENLHL